MSVRSPEWKQTSVPVAPSLCEDILLDKALATQAQSSLTASQLLTNSRWKL